MYRARVVLLLLAVFGSWTHGAGAAEPTELVELSSKPEKFIGKTLTVRGILNGNRVSRNEPAGGYLFSVKDASGNCHGNCMGLIKKRINFCATEEIGKQIETLDRRSSNWAEFTFTVSKEGKEDCCGAQPYYLADVTQMRFVPAPSSRD